MKAVLGAALLALGTLGGAAYAAQPASLVDVQGAVLVNSGHGFKAVSGPVSLNAGDRVLVRNGGLASFDYGAGCRVQLNVGVPATVSSTSPCVKTTAADLPVKAVPAPAYVATTAPTIGWIEVLVGTGIGIGIGALIFNDDSTWWPVTGYDPYYPESL